MPLEVLEILVDKLQPATERHRVDSPMVRLAATEKDGDITISPGTMTRKIEFPLFHPPSLTAVSQPDAASLPRSRPGATTAEWQKPYLPPLAFSLDASPRPGNLESVAFPHAAELTPSFQSCIDENLTLL